jgi:hypothetical protein
MFQLNTIKNAIPPNTITLGYFNIDYEKRFYKESWLKDLLLTFDELIDYTGLIQLVNFSVGSWVVLNKYRIQFLTTCTAQIAAWLISCGTNHQCLGIQSLIAGTLNESNYVLVTSKDLSAAFEMVNKPLLLKHHKIIGLSQNLNEVIKTCLRCWAFYISVIDNNSILLDIICGTV